MPFIWRVRVLVASINTEPGKEGAVRVFCHFIATFSLVVKATHFRDLTDTPEALGGAYAPPTCVGTNYHRLTDAVVTLHGLLAALADGHRTPS